MAHNDDYVYSNNTETIRANLAQIATGIFLNIDNNMLSTCQKALDTAMLRVCGSTENCDELTSDGVTGARSLKYNICTGTGSDEKCYASADSIPSDILEDSTVAWNIDITGMIPWGDLSYSNNQYTGTGLDDTNKSEIDALSNAVKNAINAINSDPVVQYCMTGRKFQGYKEILGTVKEEGDNVTIDEDKARFPNLTNQIQNLIWTSVLRSAYENYVQKYDELTQQKMKDSVKIASRTDEATAKATAREACNAWHSTKEITTTTGADGNTTVDLSNTNYANVLDALQQRETHAAFNEITGECIITTRYQKCELSYGFDCLKYGEWVSETTTIKLLD